MILKYRIKEHYDNLCKVVQGQNTNGIYRLTPLSELYKILGVSKRSWCTYMGLKVGDKRSIKSDTLYLLANLLGVTMEQMYSEPPQKVKLIGNIPIKVPNDLEPIFNEDGITVEQAKQAILNLKEKDSIDEPFRLWVETEKDHSNLIKSVCRLNKGDVLFSTIEY